MPDAAATDELPSSAHAASPMLRMPIERRAIYFTLLIYSLRRYAGQYLGLLFLSPRSNFRPYVSVPRVVAYFHLFPFTPPFEPMLFATFCLLKGHISL